MDDFVRRAFDDAQDALVDKERDAFMKAIGDDETQAAHVVAALHVGLTKLDKMCEVVIKSGNGDTLAEYANELLLVGFHIGYRSAMEGKE